MNITLTAEHRDALYEQVLVRTEAIDDIMLVVRKGDFSAADRLALEHSDNLRLMVNDLGWESGPSTEPFTLASPPDLLRRFFTRHLELAVSIHATHARDRAEVHEEEEQNRLVVDVCTSALAALGSLTS